MRAAIRGLRRRAAAALRRRGWTRTERAPVAGLVEEFSKTLVVGWVAAAPDAGPVRVSLLVNRTEVATATATPAGRRSDPDVREFRFKVRGLWDFVSRSQRLSVRVEGQPLPIVGHGLSRRPDRNGSSTVEDLTQRLAAGHVFGQTGDLQLSRQLDTEWQGEVLALYDGVRAALATEFGYEAFVVYGSLLGAVREGGFIGHDLDFDAAYVSKHSDPAAAGAELQAVALRLIERGFDVDCRRIALHIHAPSDPQIRIDLFHLFFDADGVLSFPFGVAGTTDVLRADWRGVRERPFGPARVLAPVNAEQVVEAIYGAGWRQPNPGFSWKRDRTKKAYGAFVPPEGCEQVRRANEAARVAP